MARRRALASPAALAGLNRNRLVWIVAFLLCGIGPASIVAANVVHRFPVEPPLRDVPSGAQIANLDEPACRAALRTHGARVSRFTGDHHADIRGTGLLLEGPLLGVRFEHVGGNSLYSALDCRLALALLAWTPTLREFGVTRVQHISTFRPNSRVAGTNRESGHARALAIDLRYVQFEDGTRLDVLTDWTSRQRGAAPCTHPSDEQGPSAVLRRIVCRAVEAELFQVVVSPHHNDAHANHVHLEVRPGVTWRSIE